MITSPQYLKKKKKKKNKALVQNLGHFEHVLFCKCALTWKSWNECYTHHIQSNHELCLLHGLAVQKTHSISTQYMKMYAYNELPFPCVDFSSFTKFSELFFIAMVI